MRMKLKKPSFHSSVAVADNVFKTLNSVYFDESSSSSSREKDQKEEEEEDIELIIRGARSGTSRLLFEPSEPSFTPLLSLPDPDPETEEVGPFKESVVMAMESEDPYMDFRRSMEEMMGAHQGLLKDWGGLEELLAWYLKVNGKSNHSYIVAAFVDLLVKYSSSSSSSSRSGVLNSPICSSSTSRSSSQSTSCACVCGDHLLRRRVGNKSTTSFSSAASSFSNCELHD